MAFVPVKEGKSCILADQSGSGKTLAYLAPVIQRLRQEEVDGVSMSSSKSPRLVVLVPTAELASQVCDYYALNCNLPTWSMRIFMCFCFIDLFLFHPLLLLFVITLSSLEEKCNRITFKTFYFL